MNKTKSLLSKIIIFIRLSFIAFLSINFSSVNMSMADNSIELSNATYQTFQINGKQLFLKSKQGQINLDIQNINLKGGIEGKFTLENETYFLEANTLIMDPENQSIISEEKIKFKTRNFEIVSLGLNISETSQEGIKMLFKKAHFNKINIQNLESTLNKGKANNIEFFPDKNLILMKGKAELQQDNMKISSDEIHYDPNQDKILKSINAKIINNS